MIDPGGPVDPALGPRPVDEVARPAAFTLVAPGWYPPENAITQSYVSCVVPAGLVVLVQAHDDFWNLPGGQLEPGETARDALVREVAEEACARVTVCRYLACQHVWDPDAPDGRTSHYQTRWLAASNSTRGHPGTRWFGASWSHPPGSCPPCRGVRGPPPPTSSRRQRSWTVKPGEAPAVHGPRPSVNEPAWDQSGIGSGGMACRWLCSAVSTGAKSMQPIWSSRRSTQLETARTSQPA